MALIDFSPVRNQEIKMEDFAKQFTRDDLRAATNASLDLILNIINDADDRQMIFIPDDPNANDEYAANEADRYIGWSLAHLVLHVTATSEEGAAFSSLVARGVVLPLGVRLRYEKDWRSVTTKAECLQRIEESRRMRLAYLDTFPDEQQLDVYREMSDNAKARMGNINAIAAFLLGLSHESAHYDQLREVAQQARESAVA